jgi:hypothetical protein
MPSAARESFGRGLDAFVTACDAAPVLGADEVGAFLRRGMTVAAFNIFENFVIDRLAELTVRVNSGATQFRDLPPAMQAKAIRTTISVAAAVLKRDRLELPDLRAFSGDLGGSLAAVDTALALSPFAWRWVGSNLSPNDVSSVLNFFQVKDGWRSLLLLAERLGFETKGPDGSPIDLKQDLESLVKERNKCAHVSTHPVTLLWLRAVPLRLLRIGVAIDVCVSLAAYKLMTADASFLAGHTWSPNDIVKFRVVQARRSDFAELLEGKSRAYRVSQDGRQLYIEASGRCGDNEVAVFQDAARQIRKWAVPCID